MTTLSIKHLRDFLNIYHREPRRMEEEQKEAQDES